MKKLYFFIPILLVVVGISIFLILHNKNKNSSDTTDNNDQQQDQNDQSEDPNGTILIEAGEGTLVVGGSYSYIAESARGLEAYLGDKGASAVYQFNADTAGYYKLWVKLTDDGLYTPGTRNVTIVINDNKTLVYNHVPEDTKGWKWYEIGLATLQQGSNKAVFTKNEDTAGAYVMDEFKFIPE